MAAADNGYHGGAAPAGSRRAAERVRTVRHQRLRAGARRPAATRLVGASGSPGGARAGARSRTAGARTTLATRRAGQAGLFGDDELPVPPAPTSQPVDWIAAVLASALYDEQTPAGRARWPCPTSRCAG
ncbi:MAG: hypothetical protein MZW92_66065 [Comamonadaceae bacterium]|nr:hypothetical protein [Comamonadaceae bacterium]